MQITKNLVYSCDNFVDFPEYLATTFAPGEFGFNGLTPDPSKVVRYFNPTTGKYEIELQMVKDGAAYKGGVVKTGGRLMVAGPQYFETTMKLPEYASGIWAACWARDWKLTNQPSWKIGDPIRVFGYPHQLAWDSSDAVFEIDAPGEWFGASSNWPTPTLVQTAHLHRPEYKQAVSAEPNKWGSTFGFFKPSAPQTYHKYGVLIIPTDPGDASEPNRSVDIITYIDDQFFAKVHFRMPFDRPLDWIWNMGRHDSGNPPDNLKMRIASMALYSVEVDFDA